MKPQLRSAILLLMVFCTIKVHAQNLPPGIPENSKIIQGNDTASVDWTNQLLTAKGWSFLDTIRFKNRAQAEMMATRGAIAVAQRNLLELVMGINVTSVTTVRDYVTESDVVVTKLQGMMKNSRQVGKPVIKNGMVEVVMQVAIYDVTSGDESVASVIGKKVSESSAKTKAATVLCDSNGFKPSLLPVVKDLQGNLIYNLNNPKALLTGKKPVFLKSSDAALSALEKGKFGEVAEAALKDCELVVKPNAGKGKMTTQQWLDIGKTALKIGSTLMLFI